MIPDSDVVYFLSGSTDSAINFSRSADLHTHIHPPPKRFIPRWFELGNKIDLADISVLVTSLATARK